MSEECINSDGFLFKTNPKTLDSLKCREEQWEFSFRDAQLIVILIWNIAENRNIIKLFFFFLLWDLTEFEEWNHLDEFQHIHLHIYI